MTDERDSEAADDGSPSSEDEGAAVDSEADEGGPAESQSFLRRLPPWVLATVAVLAVAVIVEAILIAAPWRSESAPQPSPSPSATATTTPSSTPSASASPTVTASATPQADPDVVSVGGPVTTDPLLPTAQPISSDVWSRVSDGWVLATYSPAGWDGKTPAKKLPDSHNVVYLVSPDGTRYQVLEFTLDSGWRLVWWDGQDSEALFCAPDPSQNPGFEYDAACAEFATVSLRTGVITRVDGGPTNGIFVGTNATGDLIFSRYAYSDTTGMVISFWTPQLDKTLEVSWGYAWPTLDPTGSTLTESGVYLPHRWELPWDSGASPSPGEPVRVATDVLNAVKGSGKQVDLARPTSDGYCTATGWASSTALLVTCGQSVWATYFNDDYDEGPTLWSVPLDGAGSPTLLATLDYAIDDNYEGVLVVNGTIVALKSPAIDGVGGNTAESVALVRDGVVTDIPSSAYGGATVESPQRVTAVGGRVYVEWGAPGEGTNYWYLSAYQLSTGKAKVLLPKPSVPKGAYLTRLTTGCVVVGGHVPCVGY